MSLTEQERFTSFPAIFDALTINHIKGVDPNFEIEQFLIMAGGSIDAGLVEEMSQDLSADIRSGDLGTVLAACSPVNGLAISSSGEIQYQKRKDGAVYESGANHVTLNSVKGFLYPTSISASQDEKEGATITTKYHALRSGANPPFLVNVGQNLVGASLPIALYKLGPFVHEGTIIGGTQQATVNTGIRFSSPREGGNTSAAVGSIDERKPTLEVETTNLALAGQVGTIAKKIATGCTQYFRKVGAAPTDPVHISFTFGAGTYAIQSLGVSGDGDALNKLIVTPQGVIAYSTTAIIP